MSKLQLYCQVLEQSGLKSAGVITPYSAQKQALLRKLQQTANGRHRAHVEVGTVDGFQGKEMDVIIVACVRANKHDGIGFLTDTRRTNVALTRAKSVLVVVGCFRVLCENSATFRALYDDAAKRDCLVTLAGAAHQQHTVGL